MNTRDPDGAPQAPDEEYFLEELFARGSPNPLRAGCPSPEVLLAVAQRDLDLGDTAYKHLSSCSECFADVQRLQAAGLQVAVAAVGVRSERRRWRSLAVAAAILLATTLAIAWLMFRPDPRQPLDKASRKDVVARAISAEWDLRPYKAERSDQSPGAPLPLQVRRGRLDLRLILPKGYVAGDYDLVLTDEWGLTHISASASASAQKHLTILQITLDLSTLHTGNYQLAIRRQTDEGWRRFPVRIE
jgi:hypothetical protein